MNSELFLAMAVVILGASGTYLLLPHKHGLRKPTTTHAVGGGLVALAVLLFATFLTAPSPWLSGLFFYAFAIGSVACAVLTVTTPNPVHSALWFAAVVLSTAGLFLQAGASFLAAGTVIVYAGAIIVTFLFVIMLAQSEGRAAYDRAARMPLRTTLIGFLLLFGVLWTLFQIPAADRATATASDIGKLDTYQLVPASPTSRIGWGRALTPGSEAAAGEVIARSVPRTALLYDEHGREKPHVAGLGETLYTDNLLVVELTGALLFVALIGALAIAGPKAPARGGDATRGSTNVTATTSQPTTAAHAGGA